MELKHLQTFKEIARTLSFSKAAEALNYAQPTVSAHIQSLEKELGVALFNRLGRQIQLTEAGKRLFTYAEKLANLEDEARKAIGQMEERPMGDIQIGASEVILAYRLPTLLGEFQARYPMVRLIINPVQFPDLVGAVRQGRVDMALAYRESVRADVSSEVLYKEPLGLYVSTKHRLLGKENVKVEDLAGETLLAPSIDCPYRLLFKKILDPLGIEMATNYQFGSIDPIKRFASQVGGIALLPEIAVTQEKRDGTLALLSVQDLNLCIPAVMLWSSGKWETTAVRSLREHLLDHFSRETNLPICLD
jgi:DNA-binding transcriptional LysR family regulator